MPHARRTRGGHPRTFSSYPPAARCAPLVSHVGTKQGLSDVLNIRWRLIGIMTTRELPRISSILLIPIVESVDIVNVLLLDLDGLLLASSWRSTSRVGNRHRLTTSVSDT